MGNGNHKIAIASARSLNILAVLRFGAEMGALRLFVLLIFATWLGCGSAHADKRVALVIGNSAYKSVPRLTNPVHDATIVAAMFKQVGFDEVTTRLDLDANDMRKALREFSARARDAEVAVIYYAGHGMEMDGNNYLIPTDAVLQTDGDVLDETVQLDRVLFAVEPARQLRLIILDACRDNPFAKTMKRTIASRGVGRGLAKVEPNTPNTMIAFAAKAGSTASDGDSQNGPFARALVDNLPKPGLDLRLAFGYVRDEVLKNTGYQQEPYVYGSLGGDRVSLVPAPPKPADTGPQPNPQDGVRRDYELALQLGTRDAWNAFLSQYPDGFYANLARGQLNKIAAEQAGVAAAEKARLAEQERARLAAEGAKQAEQAKAAAEARAADQARLAAEKAQQIEQAKAEAAEQARIATEKALEDRIAAKKAEAERAAIETATAPKQVAEKQSGEADGRQKEQSQRLASLPPATDTAVPSGNELIKSMQLELRRLGCLTSAADGDWNSASQRALSLFNKNAGTRFDVRLASTDALDALKAKQARVCPMVCDHGFKADGDHCAKIACRTGYRLNNDNECEKTQDKKLPDEAKKPDSERKQAQAPAKPEANAVCKRQGGTMGLDCSFTSMDQCRSGTGPGDRCFPKPF
jgi:uncharacterized caspase-like protein